MNLSQLTTKPQLIQLSIDDEEIIKEYNEPIVFYTWDRVPLDTFMKLANVNDNDQGSVIAVVKTLILDEKGKEILTKDNMLPTKVLLKAIAKVSDLLGK